MALANNLDTFGEIASGRTQQVPEKADTMREDE
jgi:hypothetical protein